MEALKKVALRDSWLHMPLRRDYILQAEEFALCAPPNSSLIGPSGSQKITILLCPVQGSLSVSGLNDFRQLLSPDLEAPPTRVCGLSLSSPARSSEWLSHLCPSLLRGVQPALQAVPWRGKKHSPSPEHNHWRVLTPYKAPHALSPCTPTMTFPHRGETRIPTRPGPAQAADST